MAFPALGALLGGLGALSTLTGGLQRTGQEKDALNRIQDAANRGGVAASQMKNAQRRSSAISQARGLSGVQEQFANQEVARQFAPGIAAEAAAANQQLLGAGQRQTGRVQNVLGGLGNALGGMGAQLGLQEPTSQPGTQQGGMPQNILGSLTGMGAMGGVAGQVLGGQNPATGLQNATESALSGIGLPASMEGSGVQPPPAMGPEQQEGEIARLRAQGYSDEQIAELLSRAANTGLGATTESSLAGIGL